MRTRPAFGVFFLPIFTFGIYSIVWFAVTRGDMRRLGARIPTTWLIIIPFVNIWWLWKYSAGVEQVTNEAVSQGMAFILLLLLGNIGMAIVQNSFNTNEPASSSQQTAPEPSLARDPATQMRRLYILKQRGAITPAEYEAKKKRILGL